MLVRGFFCFPAGVTIFLRFFSGHDFILAIPCIPFGEL
jgi:hypothetical protein